MSMWENNLSLNHSLEPHKNSRSIRGYTFKKTSGYLKKMLENTFIFEESNII